VVVVHGGFWRAQYTRHLTRGLARAIADQGWATWNIEYARVGPFAPGGWPTTLTDVATAVDALAERPGLDLGRVVTCGHSAGGHLAALVGVTGHSAELEGNVGADGGQSSEVQAILSLFGASNLTTILAQSTPHGINVRAPALELLLGAQPEANAALARQASPVFHVDSADPPLLMLHGDQDNQMPINQSHELEGAYEKLGLPVRLVVVHGAGHGGPAFTSEANLQLIDEFLRQSLDRKPTAAPGR
jgi:acetyl esterase/lipase